MCVTKWGNNTKYRWLLHLQWLTLQEPLCWLQAMLASNKCQNPAKLGPGLQQGTCENDVEEANNQVPIRENASNASPTWGILTMFKNFQVYSNNESKINLAATKKPLQTHVRSETRSQGSAVSRWDQQGSLRSWQQHLSSAAGAVVLLLPSLPCRHRKAAAPAHQGAQAPCLSPLPAVSSRTEALSPVLQIFSVTAVITTSPW